MLNLFQVDRLLVPGDLAGLVGAVVAEIAAVGTLLGVREHVDAEIGL